MLEIVLMSQLLGGQRERGVTPSGGSVCMCVCVCVCVKEREREKEKEKESWGSQ